MRLFSHACAAFQQLQLTQVSRFYNCFRLRLYLVAGGLVILTANC